MANWINSWKRGNKKNKYSLVLRLGKITVFEINSCPCDKKDCRRFRVMLLNFGFEI